MPVIIIGADTELGHALIPTLRPGAAELRLFASDADAVAEYRDFAKVAVGDISDGTHVGGAAIGAFCAIIIAAAAHDERERYFAPEPEPLFAQWADGLGDAGVARVIVVGSGDELPSPDPLRSIVDDYHHIETTGRNLTEVVAAVAAVEAAR